MIQEAETKNQPKHDTLDRIVYTLFFAPFVLWITALAWHAIANVSEEAGASVFGIGVLLPIAGLLICWVFGEDD